MRDGLDVEDQLPCGVQAAVLLQWHKAAANNGIIATDSTQNKHLSFECDGSNVCPNLKRSPHEPREAPYGTSRSMRKCRASGSIRGWGSCSPEGRGAVFFA